MNYLSAQAGHIIESIYLKYPDIINSIRERKYTVSDTNYTSRNIHTLDKANLLPDLRDSEKGWRKFNLNDLLYLYIVQQCKRFDMNPKLISSVQDIFFNIKQDYVAVGELTPTEEALIAMLTESVPISIQLYADGQAVVSDSFNPYFGEYNPNPALYIDVSYIFSKQIRKFKQEKGFKDKYDLSEFEDGYPLKPLKPENARLVEIIQENEYTKVTIAKKPNGKFEVSGEKIAHAAKLTAEDIKRLMGAIGYGKVELSIKDGTPQHLRVKESHKI